MQSFLETIFYSNVTGRMWELAQFHLHWSNHKENGSEHTLDGMEYPAEVSKCFDDLFLEKKVLVDCHYFY